MSLPPIEDALWHRIQAYQFDSPGTPLTFVQRLARENRWSPAHACAVLQEYRRYVYLCMVGSSSMVPPTAVDQAWHLHMTYTRAYWYEFCGKVLGRPLHHEPTRGGLSEAKKYESGYESTLTAYAEVFGAPAPVAIWPRVKERFDPRAREAWVRTDAYWMIPRPAWLPDLQRPVAGTAAAGLCLLLFCMLLAGCLGPHIGDVGPFRLHGEEFLPFFWKYSLSVLVFAWLLRRWLSHPGGRRPMDEPDPYLVALLQQDEYLAANAAIAKLVHQEVIEVDSEYRLQVRAPLPANFHAMEQAVYDCVNAGGEAQPAATVRAQAAEQQREKLRFRAHKYGYVMAEKAARRARTIPLLVASSGLLLGILKVDVGLYRERPVAWLIVSLIVLLILIRGLFARPPRRSRRGGRWLRDLRREHAYLRRGKLSLAGGENAHLLALAVGLYGPPVLAAYGLETLGSALMPPPGTSPGGCSGGCTSDSGGDSSSCGSGCGGCGGD